MKLEECKSRKRNHFIVNYLYIYIYWIVVLFGLCDIFCSTLLVRLYSSRGARSLKGICAKNCDTVFSINDKTTTVKTSWYTKIKKKKKNVFLNTNMRILTRVTPTTSAGGPSHSPPCLHWGRVLFIMKLSLKYIIMFIIDKTVWVI